MSAATLHGNEASLFSSITPTEPTSRVRVGLAPPDFQTTLARIGLDARSLTAAGVAPSAVLPALQAAADQLNGTPGSLAQADHTWAAARVALETVQRQIQSGLASQEMIASLSELRAQLQVASTQRNAKLEACFAAATTGMSPAQRATLTLMRNHSDREVPHEYLVSQRSDADWVRLRDALANERIATDLPGSMDDDSQSYLASVRAEPAIAGARSSLSTNTASVLSAWNTAVGN